MKAIIVVAAVLALGCKPKPCVATAAAAVTLDATCAAAGLTHTDAELLVVCAQQYGAIKQALAKGKCAAELAP
jgi:hypothetical protein